MGMTEAIHMPLPDQQPAALASEQLLSKEQLAGVVSMQLSPQAVIHSEAVSYTLEQQLSLARRLLSTEMLYAAAKADDPDERLSATLELKRMLLATIPQFLSAATRQGAEVPADVFSHARQLLDSQAAHAQSSTAHMQTQLAKEQTLLPTVSHHEVVLDRKETATSSEACDALLPFPNQAEGAVEAAGNPAHSKAAPRDYANSHADPAKKKGAMNARGTDYWDGKQASFPR